MSDFSEIFREWERRNSEDEKAARKRAQAPGPGKRANPRRVDEAEAEAASRAALPGSKPGAASAAPKPGAPAPRDPNAVMAAWLRRHGAPGARARETLDADAPGAEPADASARKRGLAAEAGDADPNLLLADWLERHGAPDAREIRERDREAHGEGRAGTAASGAARGPEALPVDARLDLHGFRAAEAEARLEAFLRECAAAGCRKVLVVHGKGNHSADEPVLKALVRRVLERSPLAGRSGPAEKAQGGSGATWVLLRPARDR